MPNQTTKEDFKYSDGVLMEVSTDSGTTWLDVGLLGNGYSCTYDYAKSEREFGNGEKPNGVAKNQNVSITPSDLVSWDPDVFNAIGGGLFTVEDVPAVEDVTPAGRVIKSGSSSTVLEPFMVRFTHFTTSDYISNPDKFDFRHTIFRVSPDAGGITLNSNGANSDNDGYDTWTLAITGECDSSRDDGDQLDNVFYADAV